MKEDLIQNTPCIYQISHIKKPNYFYIGGTLSGPNKRFRNHLQKLRKNKHYNKFLQNIYNKYGELGLNISVLKTFNSNISREELHNTEYSFIKEFKKNNMNLINSILDIPNTYPDDKTRLSISSYMKINNPMKKRFLYF
jgi:hypothetical protein